MLVLIAGGLTMCSKEPMTGTSISDGVDPKRQRIVQFITTAQSTAAPKSNVDYSMEEALWLLEAALNYGTIDPDARPEHIQIDTFAVKAPFTNDRITEAHLIDAFNAMLDSLEISPMPPGSRLVAMDVRVRADGAFANFSTQRIIGQGEPLPFGSLNTNYTGSYRCRDNAYSALIPCQERRGDKPIQHRINIALGPVGVDWYLTDIEIWRVHQYEPFTETEYTEVDTENNIIPASFFPNPNDPTGPGIGYDDLMTFTTNYCGGIAQDCEPCLGPGIMALLTQNTYDLMTMVRNSYASDPTLNNISCHVEGHRINLSGDPINGPWAYFHNVAYIYGRWNYGPVQ